MLPRLIDQMFSDRFVRNLRRRRPLEEGVTFVLYIPERVERRELMSLLERRFPWFTLDGDKHGYPKP